MASFTFGSFGDIITLTQIAYKVYDAIDSNGDIAKRVKVSQQDRETFLNVCASIERTLKVGGPMSEDDAAVLKRVVTECHEFLAEFEKYLETFNESRQIVRVARRVQSSLFKKDKSSHFQDRMRHHSTMLGLVLGPIQAKYCSQDLKTHITRSLEPWDQKPMQLQDALGRRYPVPLEVCSSFDGLLNFLQFAFKSKPSIHLAVKQQQFWLITPTGWDSQSWYIVQEDDWKSVARPGTRLGMSFYSRHQGGKSGRLRKLSMPGKINEVPQAEIKHDEIRPCPSVTSNKDVTDTTTPRSSSPREEAMDEFIASVKFNAPLPPWASYNPETRFQLLSPLKELPSPAPMNDREWRRFSLNDEADEADEAAQLADGASDYHACPSCINGWERRNKEAGYGLYAATM
ncbi:hypothetical protein BJ166DRAFT_597302 [Pestalotiopsis sp. NC0098]|nr:hypothetical protein BJ166DRAFT_597302 [Pestalotiopsis sp. NC0098]